MVQRSVHGGRCCGLGVVLDLDLLVDGVELGSVCTRQPSGSECAQDRKQEETRKRKRTDGIRQGEISNLGIAFSGSSTDLIVDGGNLGSVCKEEKRVSP